jgi:phage gpG-like protein
MASGFHGDFAKLRALARRVQRSAKTEFVERLNRDLAESAVREVKKGFREGRDPYGKSWKPKKVPNGSGPLIGKTGNLRNSITYQDVTARGFALGSNIVYAPVHQYGGKKTAQRAMLPIRDRGLGPIWSAAFRRVMQRHVNRLFKG